MSDVTSGRASLAGSSGYSEGSTGEYRPDPLEYEVPRAQGAGLNGIAAAPHMERSEHFQAVREGKLGSVHSWELVTAMDGPGTRATVFFSGCPLRCVYCHNPDTLYMRKGTPVLLDDLMDRLRRYKTIFKVTNGGVTFSGGEPLMQPAFLANLLRACKEEGIHTTIDTSGNLGANCSDDMLADIDLVLLDVKAGDQQTYFKTTKAQLEPTIAFGNRLAELGKRVWVRFVLVPGLTDKNENIEAVADIVAGWPNVERVEVLPFHQMARDKWDALGMEYELEDVEPPTPEETEAAREVFRSRGIETH